MTEPMRDGLTAHELFQRHVQTRLPTARVPSSSGALPMSLADKLIPWRAALVS